MLVNRKALIDLHQIIKVSIGILPGVEQLKKTAGTIALRQSEIALAISSSVFQERFEKTR